MRIEKAQQVALAPSRPAFRDFLRQASQLKPKGKAATPSPQVSTQQTLAAPIRPQLLPRHQRVETGALESGEKGNLDLQHAFCQRLQQILESEPADFVDSDAKHASRQPAPAAPGSLFLPQGQIASSPATTAAEPGEPKAVEAPRAEQTVALIEKMELFVRAQRPALALTLSASLGARVEIEKLGRGEISVRILTAFEPLPSRALARLRTELAARGLTIRVFKTGAASAA